MAAAAAAFPFLAAAQRVAPALNAQPRALYQGAGDFVPRGIVDLLDCGARHLHEPRTFLLGEALPIDEADGLVFIDGERDPLSRKAYGTELAYTGHPADFSTFSWPWHTLFLPENS